MPLGGYKGAEAATEAQYCICWQQQGISWKIK